MLTASATRVYPHPIEVVFDRYTDNPGWTRWAGVGPVYLAREGEGTPNGMGAVRAFAKAGALREEVVAFERPTSMDYRVIAGGGPIRDHLGQVRFVPEGQGTRVTWTVRFRWTVPGTGWLATRFIAAFFDRTLAALARELDARPR